VEEMDARRSDFSATCRAFYLTSSKLCAETWARGACLSDSRPLVVTFELDLSDLKVYDFGTEAAGNEFEKWKELVRWSWNINSKDDHAEFRDYEVIIGLTSRGTRMVKLEPHRDGPTENDAVCYSL